MYSILCKREILEKYISSLCNKPKLSSMNKSLLEQLIWHQNSTQKKTNKFWKKKWYMMMMKRSKGWSLKIKKEKIKKRKPVHVYSEFLFFAPHDHGFSVDF